MTDIHKKKESTDANTMNAVVAGIAGIIVGGAAVAATVIMSDKNNQKKAKKVLVDTKEKATEYMKTLKEQPIMKAGAHKIDAIANSAKKIVE